MLRRDEISLQPRQCSYCRRFYTMDGDYVPAPFVVINLTHGVCAECFPAQLAAAKAVARMMQ